MAADDPDAAYKRMFPQAYAESQKMIKQLKFNNWLLGGEGLGNAREWVRPPGPGDRINEYIDPMERIRQSIMGQG